MLSLWTAKVTAWVLSVAVSSTLTLAVNRRTDWALRTSSRPLTSTPMLSTAGFARPATHDWSNNPGPTSPAPTT